ncbi:MAG: Ca2+-dependent phosphoinositide-specific phospholipase C, partial [Myxococcota bacterium]|nr:Ca2+-dependent phosphoinositide-specific phospholipase C [Myxococcota bacterium]
MPWFWVAVWLTGCAGDVSDTARENPYSMDDLLTLSHVQAKGTHNSYHLEPAEPVFDEHRYSHGTLTEQLCEQGVRQLELDIHLRQDEVFEVFHLPVIDEESTCTRLVDCLEEIEAWSGSHPWHLPLLVWLEPKDEDLDPLVESLQSIVGHYDELEDLIVSVWGPDRIVTPDEVRGSHDTLPEAVREKIKGHINAAFDFPELSRLALGGHWEQRT